MIARCWRVTLVRRASPSAVSLAQLYSRSRALTPRTLCLAVGLLTLSVSSVRLSTASVNSCRSNVAPPHIVSSLTSLQNFGGNVGGSFAPVVTGLLVTATGDFTVPLLVAAGVALVLGCGSYAFIVGNLDRELEKPVASPEGVITTSKPAPA